MINKNIRNSMVMQRDQADCGVACLLSIIKFYKGNASLEKLREDSGTSKLGTSLLGLSQAAKAVGFNAKGYLADRESLMNIGKPTIIHVTKDAQFEHYMVLFNYVKDKYVLGDPGEGILYLTKEQLDKIWLTKRCLILEPNDSFKISSKINKEKRAWFYKLIKDDSNILSCLSHFLLLLLHSRQIRNERCTRTLRSAQDFWLKYHLKYSGCPDASSGNTTSPYCRAVRYNWWAPATYSEIYKKSTQFL